MQVFCQQQKKPTNCQDDVRFLNTSRTFYIIQNFVTHGNRLPDDLRLYLLCGKCMSSRSGCVNQKRATRGTKRRSLSSRMHGVLHYIAKEWMHIHNCFQKKEMQPIPLTRTAPHHKSYFPLGRIDKCWDLYHMKCVGLERPPPKQEQWNCIQLLYIQS